MLPYSVIILGLIFVGIVYLYISSRQYLIRENFAPYVSWPGGVVSPPPYDKLRR